MSIEYKMFMGKDSKDYFEAMLRVQYQPSEENTKRLNEIQETVTRELTEAQFKNELAFAELYGQPTLDFVKSISKPYFLSTTNSPFPMSWDVKSDYENEDYWEVIFRKGQFHYQLSTFSGYGESKMLEENISPERVLELIYSEKINEG